MLCLSRGKQKIGYRVVLAIAAYLTLLCCPPEAVRRLQTDELGQFESRWYPYKWEDAESPLVRDIHLLGHDLCDEVTVQLFRMVVFKRTRREVLELIGSPAIKDGPIRLEGFPVEAIGAEENWICYVNGHAVVLSFGNGRCNSSQTLDFGSASGYVTLRSFRLEKWARGKMTFEIAERVSDFGKLDSLSSGVEPPPSKGESCWTGMTGKDSGIWFVVSGNRCIRTQAFHVWH